jgi:non-heme chloroperoxidase
MSYIESATAPSGLPVDLFFQDWGDGSPVVLIHGWPLSHEMWEYQSLFLANNGLRVVTYDRRGFGKSSKPWDGYDYDTLADDLKAVLEALDLQDVTLVGFSMGGGEVARYMSRHGGARVSKVVFLSAVTPYLLKTDDNPDGVDSSVFTDMLAGIGKDRADFFLSFGKAFYGGGMLSTPVSQGVLDWTFNLAMQGLLKATLDCVSAFGLTDFRADLATIEVPTLIIHGDSDKTVPIASSGEQTAKLLPHAQYLVYEGAPHGLFITEKDRLNADLFAFITGQPAASEASEASE